MKLIEMINVITIIVVLIVVSIIAARMKDVASYAKKDNVLLMKIEKHESRIVLFTEMYPEWIIGASDPKVGLQRPSSLPTGGDGKK